MGNGKHTSGARRFSEQTKNLHTAKLNTKDTRKKKTHILFILLFIFIIAIFIFLGYQYFSNHPFSIFHHHSTSNTLDDETETYEKYIEQIGEASEKVKTTQSVTVKGAEYLEITGLHINNDNPKLSTISAKLKNLSDKSYHNVDIRITLFDKNNKEITFLDYKIDTIHAYGEVNTYATLKRNLSNCKDYTIALKKSK